MGTNAFSVRIDALHQQVLAIIQNVKKLIDNQEDQPIVLTEEEVYRTYNQLESANTTFNNEIHIYLDKCTEAPAEEIRKYTETQFKLEQYMSELKTYKDLLMHKSREEKNTTTKLPKLELPKFNGDITKFHEFWDRFEANVDKKQLCEADKLSYLLSSLEGPASEMLDGFNITNNNYTIAVKTLKSHFGQNDKVIDAHYENINNLKKSVDVTQCRKTLNEVERNLRILESLGENVEGNQFRASILSKFPEDIVYDLNLKCEDKSMKSVRQGLEYIITAKEHAKSNAYTCSDAQEEPNSSAACLLIHSKLRNKQYKTKPSYSGGFKKATRMKPQILSNKNGAAFYKDKMLKRKLDLPSTHQTVSYKRTKYECIFCQGDHYNSECTKVNNIEERKRKLKGRCYRCFKKGHQSNTCSTKKVCYYCKGLHNQAICSKSEHRSIVYSENIETSCNVTIHNNYFLQTASAAVTSHQQTKQCRLLLDCGSQRSYISQHLAQELKIQTDREDTLIIYTFGSNQPIETISPTTNIEIVTRRGIRRNIKVNVVPHITDRVPPPCKLLNVQNIDILADESTEEQKIDVLIGNDYYLSFLRTDMLKIQSNLHLIDTDFGWVISGKITKEDNVENALSVITYCQCEPGSVYHTVPDLPLREADMRFLWALESLGINDSPKSTREEEAVCHFNDTVKYYDDRYWITWPWINYPPDLQTNYGLAYGRLRSLIHRINQKTLEEYNLILKEQLKAGVIEVIQPQPDRMYQGTPPIHYLPHHIVTQEGKRGRIVYDAAAKTRDNKSLNECMYRGPAMLEDLTALLLKFRLNRIALTADVEKAFLQIGLQQEARDVTRFLWLKDIHGDLSDSNILHLRFCRVPFGIISSPFLLSATIRYHLTKKGDSAMKEIADQCYVDNLVTGAKDSPHALNLIKRIRKTFNELSMNIREWTSSDETVMDNIPIEYRGKDKEDTKLLGLIWNIRKDTLKLKENPIITDQENIKKNTTKRGILRTLASLYDPCGYAAPLILPAKLIVQELWKRKQKWDAVLPTDLKDHWKKAVAALQLAKEIELTRFVGDTSKEISDCELHCFTDASKNAFAAVVYLKILDKQTKKGEVKFLMAKSRVTPIDYKEDLKIPRLELLGYVIGKRLITYIQETLGLKITRLCLWTDSIIVLCWMRSEKLLPPFVSKRVNEIKQKTDLEYRYVDSINNPADLATRPELWETKKTLWFKGPKFLQQEDCKWPVVPTKAENTLNNAALGGLDFNPVTEMDNFEETNELYEEYSENTEEEAKGNIEPKDKEVCSGYDYEQGNNEQHEIKKLQELHFPEEMMGKETHLSRNLQLFLDCNGLLRCKGRIMNAGCPYNTKYPILIPKDCDFTDKLVQKVHESNHHVGAAHTLAIIRNNYWVPQGKAKVQRILKKCPQCIKHGGGPYQLPPTSALPSARVNYSAPFTFTGIDYFGPMFVRNNDKQEKRWICLYTCLAVRAVHMEVVSDMTTEECLLALRRFIAVRGLPELIVSDNALQFKLTAEVVTSSFCTENKIRWKFIPELSPWHGGFYERLVGLVKKSLKRTLEKQALNDTQLHTIIKEVENVTNTRPLTSVGADIEYVLKPADFLNFGKNISVTPLLGGQTTGGTVTKQSLLEGWKKGQLVLEEFKKMFIGQYLLSLRERYQHSPKQPRVRSKNIPQVGEMVLLKGETKNRENWRTGKIIKLIPGADGECRVAQILVDGKEFTRSVGHLYPLEIQQEPDSSGPETSEDINKDLKLKDNKNMDNIEQVTTYTEEIECDNPHRMNTEEDKNDRNSTQQIGERSTRAAARRAREKIAEWTSQLLVLL